MDQSASAVLGSNLEPNRRSDFSRSINENNSLTLRLVGYIRSILVIVRNKNNANKWKSGLFKNVHQFGRLIKKVCFMGWEPWSSGEGRRLGIRRL